jgi:hypothetical protein
VIFGSRDNILDSFVTNAAVVGRSIANSKTHDSRLVTTAQFACRTEFSDIPDTYLGSRRSIQHGTALTTQRNIINQRFA